MLCYFSENFEGQIQLLDNYTVHINPLTVSPKDGIIATYGEAKNTRHLRFLPLL